MDNLMVKVVVGGDTCPVRVNEPLFRAADRAGLLGPLASEFDSADLRIVNLECPLIGTVTPVNKVGPVLGAPEECARGFKAMGVDVVSLANNHIMDHGPEGLRSTLRAMRSAGIATVGAGDNLAYAGEAVIRDIHEVRIGVVALAEHEFGIAGRNSPGVNPLDPITAVRSFEVYRAVCDHLVVLLHGGNEYYPFPRPGLVDTCRFLVELGATAVICQHSHCVGCMETYRGFPIVYGQGNLLFARSRSSSHSTWNEGVLLSLIFSKGADVRLEVVPYYQSVGGPGLSKMSPSEDEACRTSFKARSQAILDPDFLRKEWNRYCETRKRFYLNILRGSPRLLRRLAGKLNLDHYLEAPRTQLRRLNVIRCQSHREALMTILSNEANRRT